MEPALQPNPTKIATKWAVISVITSIVITYIMQYMNLDQNSPVKYIGIITFSIFLLLAQKEYKDAMGGYITFGKAFSAGFRYAVTTGLLLAIFTFIYLKFLSPEVLVKSLEASRPDMEAKGMSDSQIEKAITMGNAYGGIFGAFAAAIGDAIVGAIVSLIGASIFKKDPPLYNTDVLEEADPTT